MNGEQDSLQRKLSFNCYISETLQAQVPNCDLIFIHGKIQNQCLRDEIFTGI